MTAPAETLRTAAYAIRADVARTNSPLLRTEATLAVADLLDLFAQIAEDGSDLDPADTATQVSTIARAYLGEPKPLEPIKYPPITVPAEQLGLRVGGDPASPIEPLTVSTLGSCCYLAKEPGHVHPRTTPLNPDGKSGHYVSTDGSTCWCGDLHVYEVRQRPILTMLALERAAQASFEWWTGGEEEGVVWDEQDDVVKKMYRDAASATFEAIGIETPADALVAEAGAAPLEELPSHLEGCSTSGCAKDCPAGGEQR